MKQPTPKKQSMRLLLSLLIIVIVITLTTFLFVATKVEAATETWSFSNPDEYSFDTDAIEFEDGTAKLKLQDGATYYTTDGLAGWTKRAVVFVSNQTATTLTNYQTLITVPYDSDMQADFDDIRFTDANNNLLPYWLETKTDGVSARFWVTVPSIPQSDVALVTLYYGNSAAMTLSNEADTFLFADDFNGATLKTGWTEISTGGSTVGTLTNGQWTKTCQGECDYWLNNDMDAAAYVIDPGGTWEAVTRMSAIGSTVLGRQYGMTLRQTNRDAYAWGFYPNLNEHSLALPGIGKICTVSNSAIPAYFKIQKTTNNGVGVNNNYTFSVSINGTTWTQCGGTQTDIMSTVGLIIKDWSTDTAVTTATYDYFFMKKYASAEPIASLGQEITIVSPEQVSIYNTAFHPTFQTLSSFIVDATTPESDTQYLRFQISTNGSDWYYYNGDQWTIATNSDTDVNDTATVSAHIAEIPEDIGAGEFYFKAFLHSDGLSPFFINSITLGYNGPPNLNQLVPDLLFNEDQSIGVAFDLDTYVYDSAGDALSYSVVDGFDSTLGSMTVNSTTGEVSFALASNVSGSDMVQFRAVDQDGAALTTNLVLVTVQPVNDAPMLSTTHDVTINEGQSVDLSYTVSDSDSISLTLVASDAQNSWSSKGISLFSLITQTTPSSVRLNWTPNYTQNGSYVLKLVGSDGASSIEEFVTITVTNVNAAPVFAGTIPDISFATDSSAVDAIDLSRYFSDPDGDTLSYSASATALVRVTIANGKVSFSSLNGQPGTERIVLTATDAAGFTAFSHEIVVSVTSAQSTSHNDESSDDADQNQSEDEQEITIPKEQPIITKDQIYAIRGKKRGKGKITLLDKQLQPLLSWVSFTEGGVIPVLGSVASHDYIFAVKRRYGSTLHIYTLSGEIVDKKKLSQEVRFRKIAVGNLDGKKKTDEIVIATHVGRQVQLSVLSYSPDTKKFKTLATKTHSGVHSRRFSIAVEDQLVKLFSKNGKELLSWKALK